MHYESVAAARGMKGLRLVLGVQTPGPWGIAARALFTVRKVPFVPVRQDVGGPNEELVEWTGIRNAPVAVYNDERPLENWFDIMNLAERLGSGPSLFPDDPVDRALAVGFSAEICGEGGFGWSRRISMAVSQTADPSAADNPMAAIMRGYGVVAENIPAAERRAVGIMQGIATRLHRQEQGGSPFLVGDRLGACDIHWACFSMLVGPLGEGEIIMAKAMRRSFGNMSDAIRDALDPILMEHRNRIWRDHIGLPLDYLPDEEG